MNCEPYDDTSSEETMTNSSYRLDIFKKSQWANRRYLNSLLAASSELDIDEILSLTLSFAGLVLSVFVGLGWLGTGDWPRDIAVAIYSLTANLSVGAFLSSLYGIVTALAQKGHEISYELLSILSSLEPRTSYRFSELSIRKLLLFCTIVLLRFGPDQLVNFALPQARQVHVKSISQREVRLGPIGGGYSLLEDGYTVYSYSTTGLKFMSENELAARERYRVSKQIDDFSYFLPLQPDLLYNGAANASKHSTFVSSVQIQTNFGICMNVSTGSNSCDMRQATMAESIGAKFMTAARRNDEFSVTLCAKYQTSRGKVLKADFLLSNRSANVLYSSNGVTPQIEHVDQLSEPLQLHSADQIDLVRHNMTDCFLNMMLFVNEIKTEKELSSAGIGLVIRAANATSAYGFNGGRGLVSPAEVRMGSLVYGGKGLVFWVVLFLSSMRLFASIAVFVMKPVMTGETRQNFAVFSQIASMLPDSFPSAENRRRARERKTPKVIIGVQLATEGESGNTMVVGDNVLRATLIDGRRRLHLVAGSRKEVVAWEQVRRALVEGEKPLEVW